MGERINIKSVDNSDYAPLPYGLLTNAKYRSMLHSNALILYAILRDVVSLSSKNGWCDENGDIFIKYRWKNLTELMGISRGTLNSSFAELRAAGLIDTIKMGIGRPDHIYVHALDSAASREDVTDRRSFLAENEHADESAEADAGDETPAVSRFLRGLKNRPRQEQNSKIEHGEPVVQNLDHEQSKIEHVRGTKIIPEESKNYTSRGLNFVPRTTLCRTPLNNLQDSNIVSKKERACVRARILEENDQSRIAELPETSSPVPSDALSVSTTSRSAETNPITENKTTDGKNYDEIKKQYEENIVMGKIPPMLDNRLHADYDEFGFNILLEAICQTIFSPKPKEQKGIQYVESIAKRIKEGKPQDIPKAATINNVLPMTSKKSGSNKKQSPQDVFQDAQAIFEQLDKNNEQGPFQIF